MKNIFQISSEYLNILDELEENGGEFTPEIEHSLAINESELKQKGVAYAALIKSVEAEQVIIDNEIKRLQAFKKVRGNIILKLKDMLKNALEMYEIDEIKTETLKINFRKSESVVIDDVYLLPDDCKILKIEHISKTEIKKRLKSGEEMQGVHLEVNKNIQIK